MMKTNQVFEQTASQIRSTTEILKSSGFVIFDIPPERNINEKVQQLTWQNHRGGRLVSSKSFLKIDQYLEILSSYAYQLLLYDYSIIRYSFVLDGARILSQNLLWWPCPVHIDREVEIEFGFIEGIKEKVNASQNQSDYIMRSPIRVDFDCSNDQYSHPSAHIHFQHHDCRINSCRPICFNQFMKFVICNFYPDSNINCDKWTLLKYQYDNMHKKIEYDKSSYLWF